MAEPQPINVDTDADKYLKIKGTKGWSRKMEQGINSYFSNNGNIKLEVLGWSDIALDGESQHVAHIQIFKPIPSKRFRYTLEKNLGHNIIKELSECNEASTSTEKFYQINFKEKLPIYVKAKANLYSEPSMAQLYTSFDFYLKRPESWKCN